MKTIWKYQVEVSDELTLDMPYGAEILCVQMQGPAPQLWAIVNSGTASRVQRRFKWFGTGHPMPSSEMRFIGTAQFSGLVFHLFEVVSAGNYALDKGRPHT